MKVLYSWLKEYVDIDLTPQELEDKLFSVGFEVEGVDYLGKEMWFMERTTLSVQELSAQMGISLPKAYELVKTPGFPVLRIGTRILIPIDAYKEWLMKQSTGN